MKGNSWVGIFLFLFVVGCSGGGGSPGLEGTQGGSCNIEEGESLVEAQGAGPYIHPQVFSGQSQRLLVGLNTRVLKPSGETKRRYKVGKMELVTDIIHENLLEVEVQAGQDAMELSEHLLKNYDVQYIEPDFIVEATEITAASSSFNQWAHDRIHTPEAWQYTEGSSSITVAVIDSGVDFSHPDLAHSRWSNSREVQNGRDDDGNGYVDDLYGWDYVEGNGRPYPTASTSSAYHGTHVAGIVGGRKNTSRRVAGVAPRVKVMGLKFLNSQKSGYTSNAVKAIRYAVDQGAKVINASWGSYNVSQSLKSAIRYAQSKNVLFVAASGNYGNNNDSKPFYPASYSYPNIISVTASTSSDRWMSGINYGRQSVHIAAPGSSILSTDRNDGYRKRSGSSMAAPMVAGAAALALSVNPSLSYRQLRTILLSSVDRVSSLSSRVQTSGRLNAMKTVSSARSNPPADNVSGVTPLPEEDCL